jgi:hypothetical protein
VRVEIVLVGLKTRFQRKVSEGAAAAEDGPDGFDEDVGDQCVVVSG